MEILSPEEIRIIGALIEKEYSTPDYYPMTINSLTNACNQKSSRNPVVEYDESLVENTINELREKRKVTRITGGDHRVPKYAESFCSYYELTLPQSAVLCALFLRGPQTVGEIRSRCKRIYDFPDLSETETALFELKEREDDPFLDKLPRDSGREHRYMHLFGGEPVIQQIINPEPKVNLEEKLSIIEEELIKLREEFELFKKEFE